MVADIGLWDLGFGIWDLGLSPYSRCCLRRLEFGIWHLAFGIWNYLLTVDAACGGWDLFLGTRLTSFFPPCLVFEISKRVYISADAAPSLSRGRLASNSLSFVF
jgi:hypothetical protein